MNRASNGVVPITIHGTFDLWSETGTEGGIWNVCDERATHGEVDRCPWNPDHPHCPGTAAGWDRLPTDASAPELSHSDHAGIWILRNGHQLQIYDKHQRDRLLLDWTVNLIQQPDQYAGDAKTANVWIIHTYPADLDLDTFSHWALHLYPATLTLPATEAARRQDHRCAELARLTLG